MNHFSDSEKELFGRMQVCILSPMAHIEPQWVRSAILMTAHSWANGLKIEGMAITERTVVDWARNDLARAALEAKTNDGKPFTHFLWLDTDHIFTADLACQLARHFVHDEIDAVSALYFGRSEPYLPVAYVKDTAPSDYTYYPLVEVPNCLCEVDAVGFGAIMTRREIFEKVPEPWFTIDYRCGEDIAFCTHARKNGFRFFLDGQYKLGHFGAKKIITEKIYRQYLEDNPGCFGAKIKVGLGGQANVGSVR
jgi:hypothetical protein